MLVLVPLLIMLPVAAWALPPVQIEEADRPIFEAFLGHVETGARYCTPERMAAFAAQPEDITWQASRHIRMPLVAYELRGDTSYLDEFVTRCDTLLALLTEDADGHPGWYGLALEGFRHPDHPDEPVDVIITSFTMAGLMADFVNVVRAAGLGDQYRDTITRYLDIAAKLIAKWDARGNYRVLPDGGAVYITHERLRPDKAHLTQPHNKHAIIAEALVSMYRATGDSAYLEKAVRLGARFKRCLTLTDGRYRWNYWDPAGPWDVSPDDPGKWKHWIGAEHRGGYYSHSLSHAVLLYELGLVFDRTDIDRFLRTQMEVAWNGSLDAPVYRRVDGRPADEGQVYLCAALAPFDAKLREMVYGAPAQAARMAAREHSWQGSVVAMSWLEGKYVTLPRRTNGRPADVDLTAVWAAGEGAALLRELAYEVTEPGYQPPLTPAQMPGAAGG